MYECWQCPNGHSNGFQVTEYSPDIDCVLSDEAPCEECGIEFDADTWKFIEYGYDEPEDWSE